MVAKLGGRGKSFLLLIGAQDAEFACIGEYRCTYPAELDNCSDPRQYHAGTRARVVTSTSRYRSPKHCSKSSGFSRGGKTLRRAIRALYLPPVAFVQASAVVDHDTVLLSVRIQQRVLPKRKPLEIPKRRHSWESTNTSENLHNVESWLAPITANNCMESAKCS